MKLTFTRSKISALLGQERFNHVSGGASIHISDSTNHFWDLPCLKHPKLKTKQCRSSAFHPASGSTPCVREMTDGVIGVNSRPSYLAAQRFPSHRLGCQSVSCNETRPLSQKTARCYGRSSGAVLRGFCPRCPRRHESGRSDPNARR